MIFISLFICILDFSFLYYYFFLFPILFFFFQEVKGEVKERGWEGEEGWVVVKKKGGRGGKGVTMEGMRKMTEYVVYLEESIGVAQ